MFKIKLFDFKHTNPINPQQYFVNITLSSNIMKVFSSTFSKNIETQLISLKQVYFSSIQKQTSKNKPYQSQQSQNFPRNIEPYFIGPRAENAHFFSRLISQAMTNNFIARKSFPAEDQIHITQSIKTDQSFIKAQHVLQNRYFTLLTKLREISPPFYSSRYFGHMCWETSIPAMVGYFSTMLYNPNNCAFESGPLTTQLELDCMDDFAKMFDYPPMLPHAIQGSGICNSWGHLTCGGTVANCEAYWAARNVKFLAFSLRKYIQSLSPDLFDKVKDIEVFLVTGASKKLRDTTIWEILNIPSDNIMVLNDQVFNKVYDNQSEKYSEFQDALAPFTIGKTGLSDFYYMMEDENVKQPDVNWSKNRVPQPLSFFSANGHYSMPKAANLIGLGEHRTEKIQLDLDSRMDTVKLQQRLDECVKSHIPVLIVTGIAGSTQESAFDNIEQILMIKKRMAAKGLFFHFHIDGAYGSYFSSIVKEIQEGQSNSLSPFVVKQLEQFKYSDSITFDPHKTGYVPYACGGVIYRNQKLKNNLSFSASVIFKGTQPNVSINGIQGSKPGAAISAVYLSLQVMPLTRSGHGELLQRTMINTKIFTASLYLMKKMRFNFTLNNSHKYNNKRFQCCLLPRSFIEKYNCPEEQEAQDAAYERISKTHVPNMNALIQDPSVAKYYYETGPDLNIVCYCVNFIDEETGTWNTSLKKIKKFNETIVLLSKPSKSDLKIESKDLFLSEATITQKKYGNGLFDDFLKRHGLVKDDESLKLIRSTIMNPFFTEQNSEGSSLIFINQLAKTACKALDYLAENGWKS